MLAIWEVLDILQRENMIAAYFEHGVIIWLLFRFLQYDSKHVNLLRIFYLLIVKSSFSHENASTFKG